MSFKLPKWTELSKDEQIPIVNLPIERTYFVRGGPGTGKSILAIHRAAKIKDLGGGGGGGGGGDGGKVKILVYNKALQLHLMDALKSVGLDTVAQTCHSWLYQLGFKLAQGGNGLWNYDWDKVRTVAKSKAGDNGKLFSHLILDEAQDIPRPLLEILAELSEVATIFVDDRQAISDEARKWGMVALADIRAIFDPGQSSVYDLSRNFRNTQPILDMALAIRPLDDYDIPDTARRTEGARPTIEKVGLQELVKHLKTYCTNQPANTVGVAVPETSVMYSLHSSCLDAGLNVQIYTNQRAHSGQYRPSAAGITILHMDVIKGLEFDAFFVPFLDSKFYTEGEVQIRRNLLYVACTRPREYLALFHDAPLANFWIKKSLDDAVAAEKLVRRNSS